MSIIRPREIVCLLIGFALIMLMVSTGGGSASAAVLDDVGAFTGSKTVTREFQDDDGQTETIDSRKVTVKVDHTQNLRGRERVAISWSGAHPSGARASDPYGENGLKQEYPVVIMQCRGIDDPSLPKAKQLDPSTCWTSTRQQRSQSADESAAPWRHDLYATEANRAQKSGVDPIPAACKDVPDESTHLTPFVAASGKVYTACNAETMPPEAAVGAAFPPAELSAFTDLDGNGSANYEVRSATENESLGCVTDTPCSIVVIPIMGISCIDTDQSCTQTGQFRPGSSNFASVGVDTAVSPLYWWTESNWRNRIAVPLSFGLPPDACQVLDKRAPVAFYGSELMNQASLQWAPSYCLNPKRFKFQHNRMGDDPAYVLVEKGDAPAAFVSGTREADSDVSVAYAPTAVTGFAIGYVIDNPDNAGERTKLNLNARLLAKLLTQSYTGSTRGQQHPGMAKNPMSINQDPEFKALNPGLDSTDREAAATLLSLSESSDVVTQLTEYIKNDAEAMAFVKGRTDPWGMAINPTYKGISLPVDSFPLLDEFVPTSGQACQLANPSPYFSQLAAPVNSITKIAQAVLDGWPYVQTKCDRATSTDPWKVGRSDRQGVGSRFMLGIVSLGDAERYGLHTASLQTVSKANPKAKFTSTAGRTFVAPTVAGVAEAVKIAKNQGTSKAFELSVKTLATKAKAYPGTMIVYTVARTNGMDKGDAKDVASFIRLATSEGQIPGSGNGKLPQGYLPIKKSGATSALYASAQKVAKLVEAQKPPKTATAEPPAAAGGDNTPAVAPGDADAPTDETLAFDGTKDVVTASPEIVATAAQESATAGAMLPLLIVFALLAGLAGPITRIAVRLKAKA